jgi:Fur-regulated basic protein A
MSKFLREAVEKKKQFYMKRLLEAGIYKESDLRLYQLTLSELKQIYQSYQSKKATGDFLD